MAVETALKWIDDNSVHLTELSDQIWQFAETALKEYRSSRLLQDELEAAGFLVESGLAGMPTAFRATWGRGKPVIGFLAEYDALPELSQKPLPYKEPVEEGAPGHGCGHNLLGTAVLGAALGLKAAMEEERSPGTIVLFGCPAEEIMVGKVFLAREGLFDQLDVALTWHPGFVNSVIDCSWLAMNSVKFNFHGITSHAAAAPEMGRSALDAVELMNIGVNYLREHITSNARVHYVITSGGGEPNVVPKYAQVWYYVRAPKREEVDAIQERIVNIARGAALMTDTKMEVEFLSGCYDYLNNEALNRVLFDTLNSIPLPAWDEADRRFAREISETLPSDQRRQIRVLGREGLENQLLHQEVLPLSDKAFLFPASTDVADVSWVVPTGQIMTACYPTGVPGHSWQVTATGATAVAHKGMLFASRVLAGAAGGLLHNDSLLGEVREEFLHRTRDKKYRCAVPDGVGPPVE